MVMKIMKGFDAEGKSLASLPTTHLKASEVIEQGLLKMSLASLYRALDTNRFFAVIPNGNKNGRMLPAWQFVEPVPELLPRVLNALRHAAAMEINTFLVTECDELNEVSPAEVLAGKFFENRLGWEPCQERMLEKASYDRQQLILSIIKQHSRE